MGEPDVVTPKSEHTEANDMANLATVRDAVDAKLATLWTAIQNRQDTFFATNGRYWEGRRTHTVTPADGTETLPDIGTSSNTGSTAWPTAIRNTAMPMAIQIDAYMGPLGAGYQATVWVTVNGTTYTRTAQVGPETHRTQAWGLA